MKLIVNIHNSIQLMPHFIKHYRQLGVTQFIIGIYKGIDNPLYSKIQELIDPTVDILHSYSDDFFDRSSDTFYAELRDLYISKEEWYILVDADEFISFKNRTFTKLNEVINYAESKNVVCIGGRFLDRISVDGSLPTIDSQRSLESQFPHVSNKATKCITNGCDRKICLLKGYLTLNHGHHTVKESAVVYYEGLEIHHYKWVAGLLERLKERVGIFKQKKNPHTIESERTLIYFEQNSGKFNLKDFKLNIKKI